MSNATVNRIAAILRREDRDLTIVEAVASARRMMVAGVTPENWDKPVVRPLRFEQLDRR